MSHATSLQAPGEQPCRRAPANDGLPAITVRVQWDQVASRFRLQLAKYRQRQDLAALDDRLLRDIGITRAQRLREVRKGIWD